MKNETTNRQFKTTEAKQLIKYFKEILKQVINALTKNKIYYNDLEVSLNNLKQLNYLNTIVLNNIDGKEIDFDDDKLKYFISSLYYYKFSLESTNNYKTMYLKELSRIKSCIDDLSHGNNFIKWFFLSKNKKERINISYKELNQYKNSTIISQILSLLNELTPKEVSYAIIKNDFLNNLHEYYACIKNNFESTILKLNKVSYFENIVKKYDNLSKFINDIKFENDEARKRTKNAAYNYLHYLLYMNLLNISIDEISKDKNGISVKLLKNAGYKNLASIYKASTRQLSYVDGIGYITANKIKKWLENYNEMLLTTLKIKLSVDDQNQYTSELVSCIYQVLNLQSIIKKLDVINVENGDKVKSSIAAINNVENILNWLFISESKKVNILNAYSFLKDIYEKYSDDIEKLYEEFLQLNTNGLEPWEYFKNHSIDFNNVIEEVCPELIDHLHITNGLPNELLLEIEKQPIFIDGLNCTLRNYQTLAVKYILHQKRALIGDEMGLGKTIEAIAAMVSLKNTGATHFLVICPASVLENWYREIAYHSNLKAIKIYGFNDWIKSGGVAVINYESTSLINFEENFHFSLLVVDEAHFIKNTKTNRSQNTILISTYASYVLFLTGTALENNVNEMISLISILRSDIAHQIKPLANFATSSDFRVKIAPVYFRRKRDDVLAELPEKTEIEEFCNLNAEEKQIYTNSLFKSNFQQIRRLSFNIDNLSKSSKTIRMKEIVETAIHEDRKVLIFSYFLDTIFKLYDFFSDITLTPITGALKPTERQNIIDEFSSNPKKYILLLQINSGGIGLNIQKASVVIICEPQLKPSTETQAISRVYRMGQSRKVLIYRLIAKDTIEEKIRNILHEKQLTFDTYADKSVAAECNAEIDEKTLSEIINDEINKNKSNQNDQELNLKKDDANITELTESSNNNYSYYQNLMKMSYKEAVSSLLQKYGKVNGNYFLDAQCKQMNNSIKKGNQGLFIHHIDEDKAIMLSTSEYAAKNPFEYQKSDRLVYCNLLEHFFLHILIYEEPKPENANRNEKQGLGGAINFICMQLNDCYSDYNFKRYSFKVAKSLVINDYESYILMSKRLWQDIENDNMIPRNEKRNILYNLIVNNDGDIDNNLANELKSI